MENSTQPSEEGAATDQDQQVTNPFDVEAFSVSEYINNVFSDRKFVYFLSLINLASTARDIFFTAFVFVEESLNHLDPLLAKLKSQVRLITVSFTIFVNHLTRITQYSFADKDN